jgi:hypothetical protein
VPPHLPGPLEIRELLVDLLGREVSVRPSPPLAPTAGSPCTVGVYVDDSLLVTALVVLDLPLAAHAGAAIGLVTPVAAVSAIDQGLLDGVLREYLTEVFNVAAALFNVDGATRLRRYAVHHAGLAPPDVLAMSLTLGRREDLAVDVAGYGSGRLSVVLVR